MNTKTKKGLGDGTRLWFECEKKRRWSEVVYDGLEHLQETKNGDICNFSGCLQDHKVTLIKKTKVSEDDTSGIHGWFRGYEKFKDSPKYKSMIE